MKPLNVRFPEKQLLQIGDLMDCLGINQTDVSRAAMALGLQQIKELAARDNESAVELVAVTAVRVKQ
jgi:hypothetical protein